MDDAGIDWDELRSTLSRIRDQGYGITTDDHDVGAHSVSAPIFDASGNVVAGMSIAGPSIRFDKARIDRYIGLVTEATSRISDSLGYNPPSTETVVAATEFVSNSR